MDDVHNIVDRLISIKGYATLKDIVLFSTDPKSALLNVLYDMRLLFVWKKGVIVRIKKPYE